MEEELIQPGQGDFYRHFKGNLYQVKLVAKDSEDGSKKVIYQALYPPYEYFVRSLSEFFGPVDGKKYPEYAGKQRFERVSPEQLKQTKSPDVFADSTHDGAVKSNSSDSTGGAGKLTDEELEKVLCFGDVSKYIGDRITRKEVAERGLMLFLDAGSYRKKRRIFIGLEPYLNEVLLSNIAVTLDLVLEEEEKEAQYDAILKCLGALEHYEGGRLR